MIKELTRDFFAELQIEICRKLEELDGPGRFREDQWVRDEGGGGRTRVMEDGAVFEKAGVNFSEVFGHFEQGFAERLPLGDGTEFYATGISLVLHPSNPFVPTVHANFRYLERGSGSWFGGGTDLTPYYPKIEDVVHFHRTLKTACDDFDPEFYPRFKKWCDEYFFLKHRGETRGVGGQFLLQAGNLGAQGLDGLVDGGSGVGARINRNRRDGGDRSRACGQGLGRGRHGRGGGRRTGAFGGGGDIGCRHFLIAAEHTVEIGTRGQTEAGCQRKSQKQALFEPLLCWNSPHHALRCPGATARPRSGRSMKFGAQTQPRPPQIANGPELQSYPAGRGATRDQNAAWGGN